MTTGLRLLSALGAQALPDSPTVIAALLLVAAALIVVAALSRRWAHDPSADYREAFDRRLLEAADWLAGASSDPAAVARTAQRAAHHLLAAQRFALARIEGGALSALDSDAGASAADEMFAAYGLSIEAARAGSPSWRDGPGGLTAVIAPIRSAEGPLGVLVAELAGPPRDQGAVEERAARLAAWLAPLLERIALRKEVEAQAGELVMLGEISRRLISLRPLEERWSSVAPLISQVFGLAEVRIYLLSDDLAVPLASSRGDADDLQAVGRDQGAVGRALATRNTSFSADHDEPIGSELAVPLMVEDRLLGVMALHRDESADFSQEAAGLAEMLAGQLAIAALEAQNYSQQQEYTWYNTVMLEVTRHAAQPGDVGTALRAVLQLTTMLAGAGWALLLLAEEDSDRLIVGPSSGVHRSALESLEGVAIDPAALGLGAAIHESQAPYSTGLPAALQAALGKQSCLAMTLSDGQNLLGVLLVSGDAPPGPRRALIPGIAHQISLRIENSRLVEELAGQRALERELETARNIQESFLPHDVPRVSGWDVGAKWLAARQVGGDFFDFIPLAEGPNGPRWGVVIADVADKGVPAALFMALCRTLVRSVAVSISDPAEVLERTNDLILADTRADLFVSLFYGLWEPNRDEFSYANAGHNPPLIHDPTGELRTLPGHGMVLGVSPTARYQTRSLNLTPGSTLVLYTDGVTEASDRHGEFFGMERLCQIVKAESSASAPSLANRIHQAVLDFCMSDDPPDDLTTVVMRRTQT